ncbi:MAG: winged helix-turn-helix domain-containing protein [Rhodanobacteraceae bacterium]|nr:winged helix-turn-helix domain-containing protein [Rhodanobacteraceae bacterium]
MNARYRLDDLTIDLACRRVQRGDTPLELVGLTFDVLACLLARGQSVVSFDELIASVWAPAVVSEETVTQRIKLLRQALGDDGRKPRYIRSIRGKGYQLCSLPQHQEPDADPAPALAAVSARSLRWPLLLTALPLAVLGVLVWKREATPPLSERDEQLQRARYYAGIGQKDDVERAIVLYEELLTRNAHDRAAQTGLSFAYSTRVCLYNQAPTWADRAQALAEAVLAAEPRNSLAVAALGYAFDCRGAMNEAITHYERAVALDPGARIDSAASLAYLYMVRGRLADALLRNLEVERHSVTKPRFLEIQIARNLELLGEAPAAERRYARSFRLYPDNVYSNAAWPRYLFLQNRFGEAEIALTQAQQRSEHPDLYLLQAELALLRGQRGTAATAYAAAARLRPHASLAQTLAQIHAESPPDTSWLTQHARKLSTEGMRGGWPENQIELAAVQLARGDKSAAIAALRGAVDEGWRDRAYLQTSALFRPLADEPAFAALLDDIASRVTREREAARDSLAAASAH